MTIESPCVKVCTVDRKAGRCHGCARTLEEIGNWVRYTPAQRARIMAELPARITRDNDNDRAPA